MEIVEGLPMSYPTQQEYSDDDLPDLLDADYDSSTDSEGPPELVGVLSDEDDEMPARAPHTSGYDSDDEPPPLVEDSDCEDLPELVDAEGEHVTRKLELRPRMAVRSLAYGPRETEVQVSEGGNGYNCWHGATVSRAVWARSDHAVPTHITLPVGTGNLSSSPNELPDQLPEKLLYGTAMGKIYTDLPGLDDESAPVSGSGKSKVLLWVDDKADAKAVECPVASTGLAHRRLVKAVECPVKSTGTSGVKHAELQEWSTGLFDCFEDMPTCLLGTVCPSILYGKTRSLVLGLPCAFWAFYHFTSMMTGTLFFGCCLCYGGLAPMTASPLRMAIRDKYGLKGATEACPGNGLLGDCAVHCCCHACALCQEHREVKFREGMEKGGTYTAPPVVEEMEKRVAVEPIKSAGAEEDAGGIYYTLLAGE